MEIRKKYDVLIAGGGLAGLTLALQLKKTKSDISILLLEKRSDDAPIATHKVGESVSELGSSYLREVLNLKEYLTEHQLPKFGFLFFFSPEHNENIARRVEVGSRISNPYPSHQIDRGILENEL
ncbi:MAG: NAD(P)-binding protein, partial [Segetibacter sp.]|nr:NAD(P)-binding protein [Segetibacter sp.]